MLSVYPFGSGSLYTASYAITSSFAAKVGLISYVVSASTANTVLFPESGSRGKSICLLTTEQYLLLSSSGRFETCNFPP
jgi:hypothetical protein